MELRVIWEIGYDLVSISLNLFDKCFYGSSVGIKLKFLFFGIFIYIRFFLKLNCFYNSKMIRSL